MKQDHDEQMLETNLEPNEKEQPKKESENPLQEAEEDFAKDVLIF